MRIVGILLLLFILNACKPSPQVEAQYMEKPSVKTSSVPTGPPMPIEMVMGQFDPAKDKNFTLIDIKFADREGMYIHHDTYKAFKEMWAHAQKDGINLIIRSATRNFNYQKGIWERKWTGQTKVSGQDLSKTVPISKERALKILRYSSMPGTSRHHWGSDLDFNSFENEYFEKGEGLKIFNWLEKNAPSYGFFRPYTAIGSDRPYGYEEEKWHWSYEPLAKQYMKTANTKLEDKMIQGFQGAETATEIKVVDKYVKGISNFESQNK